MTCMHMWSLHANSITCFTKPPTSTCPGFTFIACTFWCIFKGNTWKDSYFKHDSLHVEPRSKFVAVGGFFKEHPSYWICVVARHMFVKLLITNRWLPLNHDNYGEFVNRNRITILCTSVAKGWKPAGFEDHGRLNCNLVGHVQTTVLQNNKYGAVFEHYFSFLMH